MQNIHMSEKGKVIQCLKNIIKFSEYNEMWYLYYIRKKYKSQLL